MVVAANYARYFCQMAHTIVVFAVKVDMKSFNRLMFGKERCQSKLIFIYLFIYFSLRLAPSTYPL
jgi:hypothetical protein